MDVTELATTLADVGGTLIVVIYFLRHLATRDKTLDSTLRKQTSALDRLTNQLRRNGK